MSAVLGSKSSGSGGGGDELTYSFISGLTAEEKLLIIVGSAGAVLLLVLLVVCLVGEVCPLHGLIYKGGIGKRLIKPASDACCIFVVTFTVIFTQVVVETCS